MKTIKRKICFVTIVSILSTLILSVMPVSATLEDMPKDLPRRDALKDMIKNKADFEVLVDVDNDKTFANELDITADVSDATQNSEVKSASGVEKQSFKFNKIKSLKEAKKSKKHGSIWVTKEKFDKYLTPEGKQEMDKYLDMGYSIYFIGLEDENVLNRLFTGEKSTMELDPASTAKQKVAFVTKNKNGEYFFGHILSSKDATDNDVLSTALTSSWNRKNDLNYTRKHKNEKFSNIFTAKVSADSGNSFTIGSDWRQLYGWTQVIVPCYWNKGGIGQDRFGDYVEWRGGFYLNTPKDGKNYYAMAFEHGMSPASRSWYQSTVASSSLSCNSHADAFQSNLLMQYAPKTKPSSSTVTFKIGNSFTSNPSLGSIEAMWQVSQSDLNITDNSALGDQFMKINFNYSRTWYNSFTSYAKGTSWQDSSVIYQGQSGATSCIMNNINTATFVDNNERLGVGSAGYNTYLRK